MATVVNEPVIYFLDSKGYGTNYLMVFHSFEGSDTRMGSRAIPTDANVVQSAEEYKNGLIAAAAPAIAWLKLSMEEVKAQVNMAFALEPYMVITEVGPEKKFGLGLGFWNWPILSKLFGGR